MKGVSKHEKKVMQWLSRPAINKLQFMKMRRVIRSDVYRLAKLNGWRWESHQDIMRKPNPDIAA